MSPSPPVLHVASSFPLPAFAADARGRICGWSTALAGRCGCSEAEARGRRLRQVLPSAWAAAAEAALLSGTPESLPLPLGDEPGTLWVEPTLGPDGPEGVVGVWRRSTPLRPAAPAARAAPAPAPGGGSWPASLLWVSPDGRIRDANDPAAALLGQSVGALRGQALAALSASPEPVGGLVGPWAAARAGAVARGRVRRRRADGREVVLEIWCAPCLDADGEVREVVELSMDVTAEQARVDALLARLGARVEVAAPGLDALIPAVDAALCARQADADAVGADVARATADLRAALDGPLREDAMALAGGVLDFVAAVRTVGAGSSRVVAAMQTVAQGAASSQGALVEGGAAVGQVCADLVSAAEQLQRARAALAAVAAVEAHSRVVTLLGHLEASRACPGGARAAAAADEVRQLATRALEAVREAGAGLDAAAAALYAGAAGARRVSDKVEGARSAVAAVDAAAARALGAATDQQADIGRLRDRARAVDQSAAGVVAATGRATAAIGALEQSTRPRGAGAPAPERAPRLSVAGLRRVAALVAAGDAAVGPRGSAEA
jgi:PAS domain-containing protein